MADSVILRLGIDAGGIVRGIAEFERGGRKITAAAAKMDKDLTRATQKIRGLGSAMTSLGGTAASLLGGFTIALGLRSVIKVITDFEKSIAVLGVVTQGTSKEMAKMAKQSRELGAITQFTANEVARGMVELARVGFTVREVMTSVTSVLDLAIVGELGIGEAAKIAASQIRTFSLDASEMERVVDTLVFITNSAATTVSELGQAMRFAGPTAAAFGFTIEKTAAFLGVLADNNLRATLGGTALRSIVVRLQKPTSEAAEGFAILGVKAREVNPEIVGLEQAFRNLSEAIIRVGRETGLEGFTKIFGRRQLSGALVAVIPQSLEKVVELEKQLEKQKRIADVAARAIENTLAGAFIRLKSAAVEATLAIGDTGFKGVLRDIIEVSADVIRKLAGMSDEFIKFGQTTDRVIEILNILLTGFQIWLAAKIGIWLGSVIVAVEELTIALFALNVATLTNAFFAIPAALALITVAFLALRTQTFEFLGSFATIGQSMRAIFQTVADVIDGSLGKVVRQINNILRLMGLLESKDNQLNRSTNFIPEKQSSILGSLAVAATNVEATISTTLSNPDLLLSKPVVAIAFAVEEGNRRSIKVAEEIAEGSRSASNTIKGLLTSVIITAAKPFQNLIGQTKKNLADIVAADNAPTLAEKQVKFQDKQLKDFVDIEERSLNTPVAANIGRLIKVLTLSKKGNVIFAPLEEVFTEILESLVAIETKSQNLFKEQEAAAKSIADVELAAAGKMEDVEKRILAIKTKINDIGLPEGVAKARIIGEETLLSLREGAAGAASIDDKVLEDLAKREEDINLLLSERKILHGENLALIARQRNAEKKIVEVLDSIKDNFDAIKLARETGITRKEAVEVLEDERLAVLALLGVHKRLKDVVTNAVTLKVIERIIAKLKDARAAFRAVFLADEQVKGLEEINRVLEEVRDNFDAIKIAAATGFSRQEVLEGLQDERTGVQSVTGEWKRLRDILVTPLELAFITAAIEQLKAARESLREIAILDEAPIAAEEINSILRDVKDNFDAIKIAAETGFTRGEALQTINDERLGVASVIGLYKRLSEVIDNITPLELVSIQKAIGELSKAREQERSTDAAEDLANFDIGEQTRVVRPEGVFNQLKEELDNFLKSDLEIEIKIATDSIQSGIDEFDRLVAIQGEATEAQAKLREEMMRQKEAIPGMVRLVEAQADIQEALVGTADLIKGELGLAISDMVLGIETASDAFREFGLAVLDGIVRRAVQNIIDLLVDLISQLATALIKIGISSLTGALSGGAAAHNIGVGGASLSSAKGNVFAGDSGATAFAAGGIITKPTKSIMGEDGPEAILPLKKGKDGKLGVLTDSDTILALRRNSEGNLSVVLTKQSNIVDNVSKQSNLVDNVSRQSNFINTESSQRNIVDNVSKQSNLVDNVSRQSNFINTESSQRNIVDNVFTAFAEGGIIDRPTKSLIGEAGPEAVLPLKRGSDGKLGVSVQGLLSEELATQSLAQDRTFAFGDLVDLPDQIREEFRRIRLEIRSIRNSDIDVPERQGIFGVPQLAEGGIVREPTLALVGEAGPEAIIPLDSPTLSLNSTSDSKEQKVVNITFNVKATDAASFRRSRNQLTSDLRRAINGG